MNASMTAKRGHRVILRLWAVQFGATLALVLITYGWLLLPDEHSWQVITTIGLGVALVLLALWLECATLAFFTEPATDVRAAFRVSARRVPAFGAWFALFIVIQRALHGIRTGVPVAGVRAAQVIPVGPRPAMSALDWVVIILEWVIVPAVLLSVAGEIAKGGFAGWTPDSIRHALRRLRSGFYWIAYFVAVLVGAYVPSRLMAWVPAPSSLVREAWSLVWRITAAYILAISTWVAFAWVLGRNTAVNHSPAAPDGGPPTASNSATLFEHP
jgi:hypothetical protein